MKLCCLLMLLTCTGCTNNIESRVVTVEKVVPFEVEKKVYVDREVEKVVPFEVEKKVYVDREVEKKVYVDREVEKKVYVTVEVPVTVKVVEYEKEDANGIRVEYWRKVNGRYDGYFYKYSSARTVSGRYENGKKIGVWYYYENGEKTGVWYDKIASK